MISIRNVPINPSTRVFVRGDLDVPIEGGNILERYRLDSMFPTLSLLLEKQAKIIIAGHVGKPNGRFVLELSTQQLLPYFNQQLGEGRFELMENLRFDPREEANDEEYAKELASKADIYVNECFSTCHRSHASIVETPKFLPSYAGLRLEKEVKVLGGLLENAQRPFVAIIGGAKLEDKKPAVSKFLEIANYVIIGGKIALNWTDPKPKNLVAPTDYVPEFKDIGPNSIAKFKEIIQEAKTVLWAGPVGVYEEDEFFRGTKEIAQEIARITAENNCFSVIGGGDTIAAVQKANLINSFSFVSTGGGAMLNFLVDGTLPGLQALNKDTND